MPERTKILVVDDEDALRLLLKEELTLHGFEVSEAGDGVAATDLLGKNHFDLVILDIRMPGMDGMEVLKNIHEKKLAKKVIMLTGVDELKIARDSMKFGANDFMTKPYDFPKLFACIDRVLKE